ADVARSAVDEASGTADTSRATTRPPQPLHVSPATTPTPQAHRLRNTRSILMGGFRNFARRASSRAIRSPVVLIVVPVRLRRSPAPTPPPSRTTGPRPTSKQHSRAD